MRFVLGTCNNRYWHCINKSFMTYIPDLLFILRSLLLLLDKKFKTTVEFIFLLLRYIIRTSNITNRYASRCES